MKIDWNQEKIDYTALCSCGHPRSIHERAEQGTTGPCLTCPDYRCERFDFRA